MFNISQIERLAGIEGDNLVSLYLDIDRKKYSEVEIKSKIKDVFKKIDIEKGYKNDLEKKTNEFLSTCSVSTKSVAIFYSPKHWFSYVFPHRMDNFVDVDSFFNIEPILNLLLQARKVGVLLFDSEQARFFCIFLGHLEAHGQIEDRIIRRHKKGGWSSPRFERKINEKIKEHLKNTVELLKKADKIYKFDILYVRSEAELENEFLALLPKDLRDDIKGWFKADMNASTDDIVNLVNEITEKEVEKQESAELEKLASRLEEDKNRNVSVFGINAVAQALFDRKVRKIFLNENYLSSGFYCHFCGHISVNQEYCPYDQVPNYRSRNILSVIADEAIKKRIEVEVFKKNPVLEKYKNIVALLKE